MSKKFISLFLALVIVLVSLTYSVGAFAVSYPYIETTEDGTVFYHRLSDGKDIAFCTDYDEMVSQIRSALISHSESIEIYFATTDENYAYTYEYEYQKNEAYAVAEKLYSDVVDDVFQINSELAVVGGGEYLYNSIVNIGRDDENGIIAIGDTGLNFYSSAPDTPVGDNPRYYTFAFSFENIKYYTTPEQERVVNYFAWWFNNNYLNDNMTEYEKVKTIYDFVVRNTTYDWDTFTYGRAGVGEDRYNIAHSAYGAICGNVDFSSDATTSIVQQFDSLFESKPTVTNELVTVNYDNGKAVCEGYSKLFWYLCNYNGIRCHIVDGDYVAESEKKSDPHEWNYVYLMDESGDGYKWFQVDCTRAAQNSVKQIDVNDYNFFLCGFENVYFGIKNHQQAYENKGFGFKNQLYDWYEPENESSVKDYIFSKVTLNSERMSQGHVIQRVTYYDYIGEERSAYIYCDKNGYKLIEVDEDGVTFTETEGFTYTGYQSTFSAILPYIVNRRNNTDTGEVVEGEYENPIYVTNKATGEQLSTVSNCGEYYITIDGKNGSSVVVPFEIVPRDMSAGNIGEDAVIVAPDRANYTGNVITPTITITDAYRNKLSQGRDYTVSFVYNNTVVSHIKDIGDYDININYCGNYTGTYTLKFNVGKIDLSNLSYNSAQFQYIPEYYRKEQGYTTPAAYFKKAVLSGLKVGDVTLYPDKDFTVSATGSMEYGSSGVITMTGTNSQYVVAGTTIETDFKVEKKYDISSFDGKAADTNQTNKVYYTGSEVKPTKFDWLNKRLVQGKDYKITGYANNIDAGYATVYIEGINGCTGKAAMTFYINHPQNLVKPSANSTIKLSKSTYVYDGTAKKPAVAFKNSSGKAIDTYYYTVTYSSNITPGTAYATINLRNTYSGSFKTPFTILPKGTTVSSVSAAKKAFTVKWKKQAVQTTGYQIQYSTNKKFSGAKAVLVTKNTAVSKKITKLKSKKTYYVRVRTYKTVGGKKYYSSWSAARAVKTK